VHQVERSGWEVRIDDVLLPHVEVDVVERPNKSGVEIYRRDTTRRPHAPTQPVANGAASGPDLETSPSGRDTNALEPAKRGGIERVLEQGEAAPALDHRVVPGIADRTHSDRLVLSITPFSGAEDVTVALRQRQPSSGATYLRMLSIA
jgi:hypothetical protein